MNTKKEHIDESIESIVINAPTDGVVIDTVKKSKELTIIDPLLIKECWSNPEYIKLVEDLNAKYWWNLEKLFELMDLISQEWVDDSMQKLKDKWYNLEKIEDMLWEWIVDSLKGLDNHFESMKSGELSKMRKEELAEIEKNKESNLDKTVKSVAKTKALLFYNVIKSTFWLAKKEISNYKENLFRTITDLSVLENNEKHIYDSIKELKKQKDEKENNWKKAFEDYLKLSFIVVQSNELLKKLEEKDDNEMIQAQIENEIEWLRWLKNHSINLRDSTKWIYFSDLKLSKKYDLEAKKYLSTYNTLKKSLSMAITFLESNETYFHVLNSRQLMQEATNRWIERVFATSAEAIDKESSINEGLLEQRKIIYKWIKDNIKAIENANTQIWKIDWELLTEEEKLLTVLDKYEKTNKDSGKYLEAFTKAQK